jgi:hypothetical protein
VIGFEVVSFTNQLGIGQSGGLVRIRAVFLGSAVTHTRAAHGSAVCRLQRCLHQFGSAIVQFPFGGSHHDVNIYFGILFQRTLFEP